MFLTAVLGCKTVPGLPCPREQSHLPKGALREHSGSAGSFVSRADPDGLALDSVAVAVALLHSSMLGHLFFCAVSFYCVCLRYSALLVATVDLKRDAFEGTRGALWTGCFLRAAAGGAQRRFWEKRFSAEDLVPS